MLQISADFLALSCEAAVLAKNDRIIFSNSVAQGLLGIDCAGRTIKAVFGSELAGSQARAFICNVNLNGKVYIARVTKADGLQAIFFTPREMPLNLLNNAFIYSMRSSMMNYGIAADIARAHAMQIGDAGMLAKIAAMEQSYYRTRRSISNMDIIHSSLEGTIFCCPRRFDLHEMLTTLIETINSLDSSIPINLPESAPMPVIADPQLIEQMMLNLISNCLVHAHGLTRISIYLRETHDSIVISVDDDGCGIAPEAMPRVFERYRSGFELSDIGGGAGLGLSVVQIITALHGGTVLLESRKGIGTTVRVSLSRNLHPGVGNENENLKPHSSTPVLIGLADCLGADCYIDKGID